MNNSTHYDLLSFVSQDNSSIIIDLIRGKDGLKHIMWTIVHNLTYCLLCYKSNRSSIVYWIRRKDRLKYKK